MPKSRVEFWKEKFDHNVQNDTMHRKELADAGWRVFTIWECEIKKHFEETMQGLIEKIKSEGEVKRCE